MGTTRPGTTSPGAQCKRQKLSKPPAEAVFDYRSFYDRVDEVGETDPDAAFDIWWEAMKVEAPWVEGVCEDKDQPRKEFLKALNYLKEYNKGTPMEERKARMTPWLVFGDLGVGTSKCFDTDSDSATP